MKPTVREIKFLDVVELWDIIKKTHNIDACNLSIDKEPGCTESAHHEVGRLFDYPANGQHVSVNFTDLICEAKSKEARRLMEAYWDVTQEFRDKDGYVNIYYWW